jgi:hypothetical protein
MESSKGFSSKTDIPVIQKAKKRGWIFRI